MRAFLTNRFFFGSVGSNLRGSPLERSSPTAKKEAKPQLTPALGLPPRTSCHTLEICGGRRRDGTVVQSAVRRKLLCPSASSWKKAPALTGSFYTAYTVHHPAKLGHCGLSHVLGHPQFYAAPQSLLPSAVFWTTSPAFCQLHPMSPVKGSNTSDIATSCLFGPSFFCTLWVASFPRQVSFQANTSLYNLVFTVLRTSGFEFRPCFVE